MSSNEVSFDLREIDPLPHNTLHNQEVTLPVDMWQRTNQKLSLYTTGCRSWLFISANLKASTGYLNYPVDVRDTAKSEMGRVDNHHLKCLVESTSMNVGGSYRNAKESSPLMPGMSVGGVIVV